MKTTTRVHHKKEKVPITGVEHLENIAIWLGIKKRRSFGDDTTTGRAGSPSEGGALRARIAEREIRKWRAAKWITAGQPWRLPESGPGVVESCAAMPESGFQRQVARYREDKGAAQRNRKSKSKSSSHEKVPWRQSRSSSSGWTTDSVDSRGTPKTHFWRRFFAALCCTYEHDERYEAEG